MVIVKIIHVGYLVSVNKYVVYAMARRNGRIEHVRLFFSTRAEAESVKVGEKYGG